MIPATDTHSFLYIDCDVADGASLREWRRDHDRAQRATRRSRPGLRLPSLRMPRQRVRFA